MVTAVGGSQGMCLSTGVGRQNSSCAVRADPRRRMANRSEERTTARPHAPPGRR